MTTYDQDIILLEQLHTGDPAAFATVYNRYRNPLRYLAESLLNDETDAQDIVQEFFIAFWEKKLFTHIDPALSKGDGTLIRNYLLRCIKNKCLNHLSRNKRQAISLQQTLLEETTPENSYIPERQLENKELELQLLRAMAQVPPQAARIFALAYGQSKSRKEIAAELRISSQTVANLLARAVKRLRTALKNSRQTCGTSPANNVY
ncbi:sigma-70 family RNA polymerase sigma factor [Chitinophaga sp. Mgbs1]|uniref:Sigma-70 family RNA polymerase sigma factor n=1 Tax=Chitinophaga solisilvae TaxID=1233460 RepID=A0A3S1D5Y4_9BACT|nr:sigma-70 family RNA polymerase sigma factor [Chitinophaga solisilvae]